MATSNYPRTPLVLLPFTLLWRLVSFVVETVGILMGLLVGFVLMVVGAVLCLTVIGSVVGLPLLFIGVLITLRAIY